MSKETLGKRRSRKSEQSIDPTRLVDVSGTIPHPEAPDKCFVDRANGVVVQVWENATPGCIGTPWDGTLRVAVKHTAAKHLAQFDNPRMTKPITWDDMQAIKDHFWPELIAIEVYPPQKCIVNHADLRWMWVLPAGTVLPFNLQAGSIDRLVSGNRVDKP